VTPQPNGQGTGERHPDLADRPVRPGPLTPLTIGGVQFIGEPTTPLPSLRDHDLRAICVLQTGEEQAERS
jgi:hypothetical protein